jgi:hypothetical protein
MILCEWDAPEGHLGQCCVHLYAFVSYRRLSPQFQFSPSAVTLAIYLGECSFDIFQLRKSVFSCVQTLLLLASPL